MLSSPRTGSTMLRHLLDDHSQITCFGELFDEQRARKEPFTSIPIRSPAVLRRRLWNEAAGDGPVGFKLMAQQGKGSHSSVWTYLRSLPQLRVIHIRRADEIAREVSRSRAQRDQVWHVFGDQALPAPQPLVIEPDAMIERLDRIDRHRRRKLALFDPAQVLEVWLEDLDHSPDVAMATVFDFLGVESEPVTSPTKRTGTIDVTEELENWEEIRRALLDTPRWRHLADRPDCG